MNTNAYIIYLKKLIDQAKIKYIPAINHRMFFATR